MHVCSYACVYVCMYVCMYVVMYVCMYVVMYVCMYVFFINFISQHVPLQKATLHARNCLYVIYIVCFYTCTTDLKSKTIPDVCVCAMDPQTAFHLIWECAHLLKQRDTVKNKIRKAGGNRPLFNSDLANNYTKWFQTFVKSINFDICNTHRIGV